MPESLVTLAFKTRIITPLGTASWALNRHIGHLNKDLVYDQECDHVSKTMYNLKKSVHCH